jgi:hypothetical protein
MKHLIFIIFFKLQVTLLEAVGILQERVQFINETTLVSLNLVGTGNLNLFEFFLLNGNDSWATHTSSFRQLVLEIFELV